MKILFAIKNMNSAKGGAERVLAQVSSGLADRGYDVQLLTCDKRAGKSYYPMSDKVRRVSLAIGNANKHAGFLETVGRIRAMRAVLRAKKPDVVVAFMHSMFIPMAIAAIGTGVPVIASEHIVPRHYRSRPAEFMMFVVCSFFVKSITVLSGAVRRSYPALIRRKMVIMPNPVEEPANDLVGEVDERNEKRKIILNVGRLDEQKDQKTLIRAFAKIADAYPDWDVKIYGEGELAPFLENLVHQLDLNDRVFLPGTTREIGNQYARASIFAIPSKYESFGLATAEAMSYGVPAIGFAECQGTNEVIINNVDGLLVSKKGKDRVEVYAQALEQLMKDTDLRVRLGLQAKRNITKYRADAIVGMWENLIKGCVSS